MHPKTSQPEEQKVQPTITARGISPNSYLDELPFNWHNFQVEGARRRIEKKKFRIINRRHKFNAYPEE